MTITDTAVAAGTQAPSREFGPITITDIVRYAGASGDFNRIHHDPEFAEMAGYPGVFAMGMLSAGVLGTYATDWLGAENVRRYRVRFKDIVWPGDVLTCTGKVVDVSVVDGSTVVRVELECTRPGGSIAIAGDADFVVPQGL